jgi:hypothetical protein
MSDALSRLVEDGPDNRIQRFSLDQRHQGAPAPRWPLPITVSPSQSPKRLLLSTMVGRSSIETWLGMQPRRL